MDTGALMTSMQEHLTQAGGSAAAALGAAVSATGSLSFQGTMIAGVPYPIIFFALTFIGAFIPAAGAAPCASSPRRCPSYGRPTPTSLEPSPACSRRCRPPTHLQRDRWGSARPRHAVRVGRRPTPDGSNAERARAFDALMDGARLREELGFEPLFPRLADASAAGQT